MNVHINTERKHAFVLRLSQLKNLWDLLNTQVGTVNASVVCADEITREFTSWEQLAAYDNPPAKMAVELTLEAQSEDLETSVEVEFSDGTWQTIEVEIHATERVGAGIKDKILDILDGTKPWYSPFAGDVRPILFALSILVPMSYVVLDQNPPDATPGKLEGSSNRSFHYHVLVILTASAALALVYIVVQKISKLWSWIFPKTYFAFGQGENRYNTVEKFQWGTSIAFVVSVTASLVVLLL